MEDLRYLREALQALEVLQGSAVLVAIGKINRLCWEPVVDIRTHKYICIYTYVCIYIYAYLFTYLHVSSQQQKYISACIYILTYVRICVYEHIYIYTYMYVYFHTLETYHGRFASLRRNYVVFCFRNMVYLHSRMIRSSLLSKPAFTNSRNISQFVFVPAGSLWGEGIL